MGKLVPSECWFSRWKSLRNILALQTISTTHIRFDSGQFSVLCEREIADTEGITVSDPKLHCGKYCTNSTGCSVYISNKWMDYSIPGMELEMQTVHRKCLCWQDVHTFLFILSTFQMQLGKFPTGNANCLHCLKKAIQTDKPSQFIVKQSFICYQTSDLSHFFFSTSRKMINCQMATNSQNLIHFWYMSQFSEKVE